MPANCQTPYKASSSWQALFYTPHSFYIHFIYFNQNMKTYLNTQDTFNVSVSCFDNFKATNPTTVNLFTWLMSTEHCAKIDALRLIKDKASRDAIKETLPAITPSGVFTSRKASNLETHTRLIQFDIDQKDNTHIRNYSDLKSEISKLPFVAYCGLSVSATGFWGLVPIAYPERHGQHVDALKRVFAHYGITIDPAPRNVVSLRACSSDPAPYMPELVMLFDLYDEPPQKLKQKPRTFDLTANTVERASDTDRMRVESCIQEILRRETYIGEYYKDWFAVGCSLSNAFGENGRKYYHQVSQNYPEYQPDETDEQFTACWGYDSQATLGTFFYLCQQRGIEYKELK